MKELSLAAALAAVAFAVPVVGTAQTTAPGSGTTTVQTTAPGPMTPMQAVTFAVWSRAVEKELDHHLFYPDAVIGQTPDSGIVRIKFNCSESGRPDKVAILKSSGRPELDRAALYAVRRIATLHPLPTGFRHDQKYAALILFAKGPNDYEEQMKALRDEATKANSWYHDPDHVAGADDVVTLAAR